MIRLLYSGDPQLDQAVNQITKSSIELAEATSNYGALKIIFSIFMIFMILIVILFIYQIIVLTKKIDIIHTAAIKTEEYFDGVGSRTIGLSQGQILIRRSFNSLSQIVKYHIIRIRLENHVDNKIYIKNKVSRVVRYELSELNTFLANFLCEDKPLNSIMDDDDIEVIEDFIIEQIYIPKSDFSISNMDQSVTIFINGIKLNYIKKLS